MRNELLESQGDLLGFGIEVDDLHLDLVADTEHFGGVIHLAPAHISEVEQAVDPAQIDKGAILSYILHFPIQFRADLNLFQQVRSFDGGLGFQYLFTGEDDVAVIFIEAHNLEAEFLADELIEIGDRFERHLGARQKGFDSHHIYDHAALDSAAHHTLEDSSVREGVLDLFDVVDEIRFLFGEFQLAFAVFHLVDKDHDGGIQLRNTAVGKFADRDHAIGLVAYRDHHILVCNAYYGPFFDLAAFKAVCVLIIHLEQLFVFLFLLAKLGFGFGGRLGSFWHDFLDRSWFFSCFRFWNGFLGHWFHFGFSGWDYWFFDWFRSWSFFSSARFGFLRFKFWVHNFRGSFL